MGKKRKHKVVPRLPVGVVLGVTFIAPEAVADFSADETGMRIGLAGGGALRDDLGGWVAVPVKAASGLNFGVSVVQFVTPWIVGFAMVGALGSSQTLQEAGDHALGRAIDVVALPAAIAGDLEADDPHRLHWVGENVGDFGTCPDGVAHDACVSCGTSSDRFVDEVF